MSNEESLTTTAAPKGVIPGPDRESLPPENPASKPTAPWQRLLLATWIIAATAYYYASFSQAFYQANKSAITALLDRLF